MDPKIFKKVLSDDPSEEEYGYWRKMLHVYLTKAEIPNDSRLEVLFVLCGMSAFSLIEDATTFDGALEILDAKFIKKKSAIMTRHRLRTHRQKDGQTIENFLSDLKSLARKCHTAALTADQHKELLIRDAFVAGILSPSIRQRLLESNDDSLEGLTKIALTMELATEDAKGLVSTGQVAPLLAATSSELTIDKTATSAAASSRFQKKKCYWCGGQIHTKNSCPAKNSTCNFCHRRGHWTNVCQSKNLDKNVPRNASLTQNNEPNHTEESSNCASLYHLATMSPSIKLIKVRINGNKTSALLDTGADRTFVTRKLLESLKISYLPSKQHKIQLADETVLKVEGKCQVELEWEERYYTVEVLVVTSLIAPIVFGIDLLQQHKAITIDFDGPREPIYVCLALKEICCPQLDLIPGVDVSTIPPITTPSRRNYQDRDFIKAEIGRMLKEDIIQESRSPWRAQSFVAKKGEKKRLVIDYSQTINKFTPLDAYPMPKIDDLVQKVASNSFFSTIDLREAYHQVALNPNDFFLTAFEACDRLFEFKRLPFGCTNAVPIFQRCMDNFIRSNSLNRTHAYLDDIIVGGRTQTEHDQNLEKFMAAAKLSNLQFNQSKCKFSRKSIEFLGHIIENGTLRPDPKRYQSLLSLPEPKTLKELNHIIGLFAYYAKWVEKCSELSMHLTRARDTIDSTGLDDEAKNAFAQLKKNLVKSSLASPDLHDNLTIETDASDYALGGVLSQKGRPVAFFSRSLSDSERRQSIIEKEAAAITECCKRWRHLIKAVPSCSVVTDQKSVSYLFNRDHASKIKNDKIARWRLDLSDLNIAISYRPGNENTAADTMSRCVALHNVHELKDIHSRLCHPGVTRLYHYCRSHNLPYSLSDIRNTIENCRVCSELKPRFFKPPKGHLIQATQPWERLSIDFIGPLSSCQGHKYILTVVDEFTRYPFAFPCKDMTTDIVIKCLLDLFAVFGSPGSVHSDRGAQFESTRFRQFLLENGVVKSRTTPYHPQGNGQCERMNGSICKGIALALKSENLEKDKWVYVLPRVLSSIRGLLCTSTNCTPHERMFKFNRSSKFGTNLPTFLTEPGNTILYKNHVRSKGDPLVNKVKLIETISPHHASVEFPDGRNTTVSTSKLAPFPNDEIIVEEQEIEDPEETISQRTVRNNDQNYNSWITRDQWRLRVQVTLSLNEIRIPVPDAKFVAPNIWLTMK